MQLSMGRAVSLRGIAFTRFTLAPLVKNIPSKRTLASLANNSNSPKPRRNPSERFDPVSFVSQINYNFSFLICHSLSFRNLLKMDGTLIGHPARFSSPKRLRASPKIKFECFYPLLMLPVSSISVMH